MPSVGIAVTTFRNPGRLRHVLKNMEWSGLPDVPVRVFQDLSPYGDAEAIMAGYLAVIDEFPWVAGFETTVEWSCMHGVADLAFRATPEDWCIYVPDDVLFTRGGLWNEYAGILAYGRDWVGGIQAPYWNASDLVDRGLLVHKEHMWTGWQPEGIPHNPHWDCNGVPRIYVNLNGAGFSLNRKLWKQVGKLPKQTWRLDEYLGFMAWKLGACVVTLPGPPRVHYFGGATSYSPSGHNYHSQAAYEEAIGMSLEDANQMARGRMAMITNTQPDACFNDLLRHYANR